MAARPDVGPEPVPFAHPGYSTTERTAAARVRLEHVVASEQARHDRPEERDRRLILDRLRRAVDGAERVLGLGVERVVGERLADRALARTQVVGDLLGVAGGGVQVLDRLAHLGVEAVVLTDELAERALALGQ